MKSGGGKLALLDVLLVEFHLLVADRSSQEREHFGAWDTALGAWEKGGKERGWSGEVWFSRGSRTPGKVRWVGRQQQAVGSIWKGAGLGVTLTL